MTKPRPRLLLSANSAWNIANFRLGLAKALEGAGFEVTVAAPADGHEGRLREAGIGFLPLWMNRSGMNPIADLQLMGRYSAILRDLHPAAYLGFTIKPNIYGSLAARAHGVRAINNVSGLGTMFLSYGWQSTLARALYRLAFARSQTVFFQNPEDRQQFISTGTVQPTQAKLLPGSGIDLNRFTPTPLPAGSPVFLFIGRLLADKGVREFVAAAEIVRKAMPDARFQILGGSDPGNRTCIPALEINRWRASGIVELLGEVGDVRPHIQAASAIVLPSYREGLPRVLLEGGAMGRPLIASDVPGCRTIVAAGKNGLLFDVRNARALANVLLEFAGLSNDRRQEMGRAARALVERDYDEQRVINAYLASLVDIAPVSGVGKA